MQKKIVAAICAAALALAMPAAAFAKNVKTDTVAGSEVSAKIDEVKNGNVTLKNIVITGSNKLAAIVAVDAAGTGAAPSNAIAGSVAKFTVAAYNADLATQASLGTKYNSLKADVDFAESITANMSVNANLDNLYVAGNFVSNKGGVTMPLAAQPLSIDGVASDGVIKTAAAGANGSIEMTNQGTGTLTVWMQEGKYAAGDANPADVAKEAQDGSKSPKTGELL